MTSALRNGSFRKLASLYTANLLTEWFGSVALMVVVYDATKSASLAAAMLLCKQVVPAAIVPLLGSAIDRHALRTTLILAFVVQAGALVGLGILGYGYALFALAVATGTVSTVVRATLRAGISRSMPTDQLRGANALLNIATGFAAPIGPALAAFAVAGFGAGPTLELAAVVMLGLAATSLLVPTLPTRTVAPAEVVGQAGEASAVARPLLPLSWLLTFVFIVMCLFSMDQPFLLAYSEESLHAGVGGYGAIFAAWGLGLTGGSLLFTRLLHWPMVRVYGLATILSGAAFLGMSVSPTITITCLIAVVGGIGNGMDWVAVVTAVQESAPPGHEARAMTRLEAIGTAGPGLGIVLGSVIADLASPRVGLLVPGVASLSVVALGALAIHARRVRLRAPRAHVLSPSIPGGSA